MTIAFRNDAFLIDEPVTMNDRILEAWRDMPGSMRRLLAEKPSEGRLLFFVILSDVIFFASWSLKTMIAPTAAAVSKLPVDMAKWLLVALVARTVMLYGASTVICAVCQVCGGWGNAQETRAAVFWSALVTAPFGLAAALLAMILSEGEQIWPALQDPVFALPPYYLGLVPLLWFTALAVATAHRFERSSGVFLGLSCATVAFSAFGVYLSG